MPVKLSFGWDLDCEYLDIFMCVTTLIGVSICIHQVYHTCLVMFMGFKTLTYLVILYIEEIYVIFRMSWLSSYHAILYCFTNPITMATPPGEKLERESTFMLSPVRMVSIICPQKLVKRGSRNFSSASGGKICSPPIAFVPMVCDFLEMLFNDLIGMPAN